MESLVYIVIVAIVIIVIRSKVSGNKVKPTSKTPVTETKGEEQTKRKIETLKKQAEDRNIYEKSLKILSSFNKNKVVRTQVFYVYDDLATEKENKEIENAGIITYKKNNLIIKKEGMELSIINEGKTVFAWIGVFTVGTAGAGHYSGLRVYSYIPGSWEKDIDQLFIKIQKEEETLKKLTEKQREKQERERWGLK